MVRHITQNIMESRPHDICHSFNICHSHSEWALQCPAFYKLLPKAIFTKTDRNQTFYLMYIFQEISFLDKLPFGRRAKFGCVYAILEVVIAKFFWGSMPPEPPRLMRLWRMWVAAPPRVVSGIMGHRVLWKIFQKMKPSGLEVG